MTREQAIDHIRRHGVSFFDAHSIDGKQYPAVGVSHGRQNGIDGNVWKLSIYYRREGVLTPDRRDMVFKESEVNE